MVRPRPRQSALETDETLMLRPSERACSQRRGQLACNANFPHPIRTTLDAEGGVAWLSFGLDIFCQNLVILWQVNTVIRQFLRSIGPFDSFRGRIKFLVDWVMRV